MNTQIELIIFLLVISFLLYTRPNILVNFSKTTLGRIILLIVLILGTLRSTIHGLLIAVVIIVFAQHMYEGFTDTTSNNLVKINVSNFITWDEANKLASDNGGSLPTKDEFKAALINVGNIDMWMPATNNNDTNYWVHVGTGYWPLYSTHAGAGGPPWGLTNTPANYRPGPSSPSTINYIYIVKAVIPSPTPSEITCPEGYTGPNADGNCIKSSDAACGEACAKDRCSKVGGKWVPLDYATNPYTCHVKTPDSVCAATDTTDSGFVNFPYEYIEQPTNANTDVVATDPNAQYFKVKTQNMTGCAGASHQFRIHTPAYKPSEGDTVQITINEYTGNYGSTGGPIAMINGGKWYHKDGQIPVLVYNTGGGCMNGSVTLSVLILKGN